MKPPSRLFANPLSPASPWAWAVPATALAALLSIWSTGTNQTIFRFFNGLSAYTGDALWANLTVLGDTLVMLTLLLPLVRRHPQLIWATLLGGLAATLWVHGLKNALTLPRPPAVLTPDMIHVIGPTLRHKSFPSGHTTTAVLLAAMVSLYWRRAAVAMPALSLALLAGISRMAVGAHWPVDVAAGVLGGWLAAVAGVWWANRWQWGSGETGQRVIAVFLLGCAVWLLWGHNTHYPQARPLELIIALGALVLAAPGLWRLFTVGAAR